MNVNKSATIRKSAIEKQPLVSSFKGAHQNIFATVKTTHFSKAEAPVII